MDVHLQTQFRRRISGSATDLADTYVDMQERSTRTVKEADGLQKSLKNAEDARMQLEAQLNDAISAKGGLQKESASAPPQESDVCLQPYDEESPMSSFYFFLSLLQLSTFDILATAIATLFLSDFISSLFRHLRFWKEINCYVASVLMVD